MGTLTIRTQPEHDTALVAVGNRLGEKTASQTLLKSLMTYEHHCEEIGVSLDIENYCTIRLYFDLPNLAGRSRRNLPADGIRLLFHI